MFVKNSLKQLLRTPVKTALLALLLCLSVLFACVGMTLLSVSGASLEQLNAQFTTIGTVEQIPNTVDLFPQWDAALEQYHYFDSPQYDEVIPASILQLPGIDYLYPPTRLPFYFAYHPSFVLSSSEMMPFYILEARPMEDCIPDHPVEMEIGNVLFGNVGANKTFYFCDHYQESPEMMVAGTTYLLGLMEIPSAHAECDSYWELVPWTYPTSSQCDADGVPVPVNFPIKKYAVVTEGFYDTAEGQRWLAMVESTMWSRHTVSAVPADATHLIMEFHQNTATLYRGRDITQEEYDTGAKVCLVSHYLMLQNGWSIGDMIPLRLVGAYYRDSANGNVYGTLLDANGKLFEPFYEEEYTIVGAYDSTTKAETAYDLSLTSIIIPNKSVPAGLDRNHISGGGPMQGSNTVFEIPNGTIDQFMAAFSAAGVENLKVQFYDNGYSELKAGLDNLSAVAWVLFASGLAVFLAVAFFFAYSLISRNARRFALERALGASRRQCVLSAVSAFLLVGAVSAALGAAGSYWVSRGLFAAAMGERAERFDTAYSVWVNATDAVVVPEWLTQASVSPWPLVLGGLAAVLLLAAIAVAFAKKATSREPMALLQNE